MNGATLFAVKIIDEDMVNVQTYHINGFSSGTIAAQHLENTPV